MRPSIPLLPALLAGLLSPLLAHATNGYFTHGYGIKAQGQAGVGIAWGQDALAAATNPANTAEVGERVDLGLTWFRPERSADITGNALGADASYNGDGKKNFYLPEFGIVKKLSPALATGVAVYGNGGLNTQYNSNPYARFGASGTAGVNLEQLFITPSIAWKPNADNSLGLGLNLAYQRFSAQGIGVFAGFSANPGKVSDQGTDSNLGAGIRLGWTGTVAPGLTLGATWASKIHGQFDRYKGLFADGGSFDIPENYGLGVAYQANDTWKLGADVQTIRYSQVGAVGNSLSGLLQGVPLGAANGPGFGWRDSTVLKLAVSHQLRPDLVLRAGLSHATQPVPQGETFLNILAPGVIRDHLTLGATWTQQAGGELSGFLAYGVGKTVNGSSSIPASFGGGNANVRLKETILGISYGWKL